ncbi:chemotaxis protein CheB [Endozoicomonas sp. 8E]|uniref:chemotaxis protein CheB n=1 Tax=Endozoicomonas sp. 8E TaxID=3035692 RepID=UPI00293924D3|nr:chemotaxis protein CheB [Endozoicomonas sp. 8E]WOG27136.1 chemotaxis protein CheB [Endozoicomonas sp. 8E]
MSDGVVVIGASAGGLAALESLLRELGSHFSYPIVVTKHLASGDEEGLLNVLGKTSPLAVSIAYDKQKMTDNHVYLAPGGYHLQIEDRETLSLNMDEPVCHSRPSVDVLFQSAADSFAAQVLGVVLTGANRDGAEGIRAVKQAGGITIAQNPETADMPVMPRSAIATGCVDHVLDLGDIAICLKAENFKPET